MQPEIMILLTCYQVLTTISKHAFPYILFFVQQYPSEDEDDYDDVDLLSLFVAMTIFGGGDDDSDDEDYDFPFYLSEEYGF